MNSPVEEIKARLDIAEFITSYVRLQKAGINYKANCPFHAEKTASFFVSPSRQIWHCFGGCGEGGDIFKFVMKIEGLDFPEALKLLAGRAGVRLTCDDPRIRSEKNRLYDICEEAALLFEKTLALTPAVKAYLRNRGVSEEATVAFRIGFSPKRWDFLLENLSRKGFTGEEIEKAGLAIRSEDGSSRYDRFRSRIIFPVADVNGRVIGFGGRIFEPEQPAGGVRGERNLSAGGRDAGGEPKYINSPQTAIYEKSRVLYGFDKAKDAIRSSGRAVLVEGYMDCVMSHQAGVKETVAASGTALTREQLKILRRLAARIVSSFDTDQAGDSATKRSLALASEFGFERLIVAIPSGKDPADAVSENPAMWRAAVESASPLVEFYFDKAFRAHNPGTREGKRAIAAILLPFIAELNDEIEKAHFVEEVSRRLSVPSSAVWDELKKRRAAVTLNHDRALLSPSLRDAGFLSGGQSAHGARRDLLEERFLILLMGASRDIRERELSAFSYEFSKKEYRELSLSLMNNEPPPSSLGERTALLQFKGEMLSSMLADTEKELALCRRELEKECVRERMMRLSEEMEREERVGNAERSAFLLREFRLTSGKLNLL
jgi:DNA primase